MRQKDDNIVGQNVKFGRFAKVFFCFIRTDKLATYGVFVTGKAFNLCDIMGQKVPFLLKVTIQKKFIDILQKQLLTV